MGSPIDVGGQYPFITFFTPPRLSGKFLLEKNPKHCIKHKSHITKVLFLCTVVRLWFNPSANSWWDRKLGIWLIGDWQPAKWKSKNRPKATLVWKNKMVTKEVYRELLISKLILAIMEKWPSRDRMS